MQQEKLTAKPWTLRYREGQLIRQGTIMASNEELANAVGQAYCNQEGNRRFVAVENPILADESILQPKQSSLQQVEWEALTAVERLSKIAGKTEGEILEELKSKRKVSPRAQQEILATAQA